MPELAPVVRTVPFAIQRRYPRPGHRYDPAVHAAEALATTLTVSGVNRVCDAGDSTFPGGGPRVVPIADVAVASLLADADGRIGPGPGAAWLPGRLLRL